MAKVLVVGGAGYVGSAACAWLLDRGHAVWVLDDLSTGHRELLLPNILGFTRARAGDRPVVEKLLREQSFDCAMHFAAKSLVAESVAMPDLYYENNVLQTEALLEAMSACGLRNLIFSSTCAIFGDPGSAPIDERCPKKPVNPYGETKLKAEELIQRFAAEAGLRAIALRYFNAAGTEPENRVGEWHEPESHLIPRILNAALEDRSVEIFGKDYPTSDGTCVRDYVHVSDLASAHEMAMLRLIARGDDPKGSFEAFNLGTETGYSVREIVRACERMIGKKLKTQESERRPGDPPKLVADSGLSRRELGFAIRNPLDAIISSAWSWELKRNGRLVKAVFLDRDGTVNEDPGYLSLPEQMRILPGVGEALRAFKDAGYRLIVVSNQSGVGRGLVEESMLPKIHDRLHELLRPWSVEIDHYELCFHRPEENCACRKPKPKLILDAARKLSVDLRNSYMIGDKVSDLGAGNNAGCRGSILVRTGEGAKSEAGLAPGQASFIADSLLEAARWILNRENAKP